MKKFILGAVGLLFLCTNFSACKKVLEPEFYSQLTSENFPSSQKDVNAILTGFYSNFNHDWEGLYCAITRGSWKYQSNIVTDEVNDRWNADGQGNTFNWGSNTYGGVLRKLSPVVARTTEFIETLKTAPLSDEVRKAATAETKCLRAWMMFLMYDFYGPVNVRLDASKLADTTYTARPSKEEYIGWMVKDLTEAIPDLMAKTNGTSSWGKVNKGLATMLLMKIYMNNKEWGKAKPHAESMKAMGYVLLPSYKNVFSQEGNNEVVWASPSGINVASRHMPCSTPWDIKAMLGQNVDQGWGGQFIPWDFVNKYQPQDKRLETIAREYLSVDGTTKSMATTNKGELVHGAIAFKGVVPHEKNKLGDFMTVGFRYADVLLSLAEIENELNGPNSIALGYLKEVTDRATYVLDVPAITASKEAFRLFLSDERGRELYWEGWRRQDMIRMGTWIPWGLSKGFTAQEKHKLFPIPPSVINESRGKIVQNPGYN